MTSYNVLDFVLKPLEIFGLQYFSLNSSWKFSKWRIFYFTIRITFYLSTTVKFWFTMFQNQKDIKIEKNVLSFLLNFFSMMTIILSNILSLVEPLLKNKSERNFFNLVQEFSENFRFYFKRKIYLKYFKKVLIQRLIFVVILPSILAVTFRTLTYLTKHDFGPIFLYFIFIYFIDMINSQLILYKFWFYVDLISLHLKSLKEIAENFNEKLPNLTEILALKKLFILILEMTKEFNNFMSGTVQFYMISTIFWLMITNYRLLEIQFGILEKKGNQIGEKNLEKFDLKFYL